MTILKSNAIVLYHVHAVLFRFFESLQMKVYVEWIDSNWHFACQVHWQWKEGRMSGGWYRWALHVWGFVLHADVIFKLIFFGVEMLCTRRKSYGVARGHVSISRCLMKCLQQGWSVEHRLLKMWRFFLALLSYCCNITEAKEMSTVLHRTFDSGPSLRCLSTVDNIRHAWCWNAHEVKLEDAARAYASKKIKNQ